ncbi:MAG: SMC-Scp complex subunit ScpB [Deltaproteobacteria bacterium]|nr:SMC-Scp complex subunit ScpB [Deltaproteobacteria bacterium]
MDLKSILEAVLFVSTKPVSFRTLVKKLPEFSPEQIMETVRILIKEYNNEERAIEIVEVARGYQMRTKPRYSEYVKRFVKVKEQHLTKSMLETLAIVAYKQPITKKEIDRIRGVDSARAIKQLLEKKLIRIAGRERVLSSVIFETTDFFLECFGLKSLNELPNFAELEDVGIVTGN